MKETVGSRKSLTIIVWCLRIIIGGVFIYSGFVKSIDLWGFIFKLEDYLSAIGISVPRSVVLIGAMSVSGFEFVGGLLLVSGSYKRVVPWLMLLMMCVMTPLTAWVWLANPIPDCGCFGDALKISNSATFFKNIVLTIGIVYLVINNHKVHQAFYVKAIQWLEVVAATLYIIFISLVCYNVQPLIDFRDYKVGTSLINDGNQSEESQIKFIYTDGTTEKEFDIDNLPSDTTVWKYVDTVEKNSSGKKSNGIAVFDGDEEVTDYVFMEDGGQFLLVIPEMDRADISFTPYVNHLAREASNHGIDFVGLIGGTGSTIDYWKDISMADYNCYNVDDTSLKELVRGNMSLVYLEDGIVRWKRTVSSLDDNLLTESVEKNGDSFPNGLFRQEKTLWDLTWIFIAFLAALWIIQMAIIKLYRRRIFTVKKDKKDRNDSSVA